MSIKLMARVWEYVFTKAEQSVLLAMADHAQDDGSQCFPSVDRIAWKTDYSARQVQRVIHDLGKRGILISMKKSGRARAVEYKINLSKALPKAEYEPKRRYSTGIPEQKGDMVSPIELKGDTMSPHDKKGDTMSPMNGADASEKGDILHVKGDISSLKGDIAMSPQSLTNKPSVNQFDHLDPWVVCVAELTLTLPSGFLRTLTESRLQAPVTSGDPYRLIVPSERAAKGLDHFAVQAGPIIRRKLSSILGNPVLIEIVAATLEKQPE